jgi:hypothetical protein
MKRFLRGFVFLVAVKHIVTKSFFFSHIILAALPGDTLSSFFGFGRFGINILILNI